MYEIDLELFILWKSVALLMWWYWWQYDAASLTLEEPEWWNFQNYIDRFLLFDQKSKCKLHTKIWVCGSLNTHIKNIA